MQNIAHLLTDRKWNNRDSAALPQYGHIPSRCFRAPCGQPILSFSRATRVRQYCRDSAFVREEARHLQRHLRSALSDSWVASVAQVNITSVSGNRWGAAAANGKVCNFDALSPGYFETMGTTVLAGVSLMTARHFCSQGGNCERNIRTHFLWRRHSGPTHIPLVGPGRKDGTGISNRRAREKLMVALAGGSDS